MRNEEWDRIRSWLDNRPADRPITDEDLAQAGITRQQLRTVLSPSLTEPTWEALALPPAHGAAPLNPTTPAATLASAATGDVWRTQGATRDAVHETELADTNDPEIGRAHV